MIVPIQRFVENALRRRMVKLSKEKYRDAWGAIKVDDVCIAGLSESRDVVLEALAWMKERAQEQHHLIVQEIVDICVCGYATEHSVFPLCRTIVLSESILIAAPQRVARMLAASARYTQLCHSLGRYKMCMVMRLSEFQSASK